MEKLERTKFLLGEERLPESWFNVVGDLPFDLSSYERYMAGELPDLEHPDEEIERAVARIPG